MDMPKVSCLCLTENRVPYLKRAVNCFFDQTYQNKELVIFYRDDDHDTISFLQQFSDDSIKSFSVPRSVNISLGDMRNLSIEKSTGEYFVQWDDDDWYHNQRIELQIQSTLDCNKEANVLSQVIMFDAVNDQAYFTFDRPWENTILCSKKTYLKGYNYPQLNQGEDTSFMRALLLDGKLSRVVGFPAYIYIFHGNNTWKQDHFNSLFDASQKLSEETSLLIKNILNGGLSNTKASQTLKSADIVKQFDFFYMWRKHFA
jgi:glycosyltransferase involved in cell wall biosynthesis